MGNSSSSEGYMRIDLLQQQREELTMQQEIQYTAHRAMISMQIAGTAMSVLEKRRIDRSRECHSVINSQNIHGIAARVAREMLFHLANNDFSFSTTSEGQTNDEVVESLLEKAEEKFKQWWQMHHDFHPSNRMPEESKYIEERQIEPESDVSDTLQRLEKNFGIDPALRDTYDRVRAASYKVITKDNLSQVMPEIERSYKKAVIDMDTIKLLKDNNPNDLQKFHKRTRKGVFVFEYREKVNNKPSVHDQMIHDFTREYAPDEPRYEGRYLWDEDERRVLAWLTYWQTPNQPSKKHRRIIQDHLKNGVTGGKMQYPRKPTRNDFLHSIDDVLLFDTIRGEEKFAASRLFAKSLQDMQAENQKLKYFIAYRLHHLFMSPQFDAFREPIRFGDNYSSEGFFDRRACKQMAIDFNKKGPQSIRRSPDMLGNIVLTPSWVWFSGQFEEVYKSSWNEWHQTQLQYGDVSDDGHTQLKEDEHSIR